MLLVIFIAFIVTLISVENTIYLHETKDTLAVEHYDCVLIQSLFYCRRPQQPIDLSRNNDTISCHKNGGQLHRFSELMSKNISVSTILHQWRSSIERVEHYSLFRRDDLQWDGYLCQCTNPSSFGKNCEYRLPTGDTFDQTLNWQLQMRMNNPWKVQEHGDVVCYERVGCNSGALCLDWREICDGVQQCMSGVDEEHCDLLEMNICEDDEYRCMNGMCIPDEFFLDGEVDCLDWSDEFEFKDNHKCYFERVSTECDDRLCPPNQWSCGDGQCILDRLTFQNKIPSTTCYSRRDQYFMCETYGSSLFWTMPNGRCCGDAECEASQVEYLDDEQPCEYLLKCSLSQGFQVDCPCNRDSGCVEDLEKRCPLTFIRYPRGAIVAPFMFFIYNRTRDEDASLPDFVLINGTVQCRGSLISVTQNISFETNLDARRLIEDLFCGQTRKISSLDTIESREECHRANESNDRCNEWNPYMSTSRVRDGWNNCVNGRDELNQTEMQIKTSCARVRRHRFRCSMKQPTCLSVTTLGNQRDDCENRFDEVWFSNSRKLSDLHCNDRTKEECSVLRQYIDQSWTSTNNDQMLSTLRIPFRFYCDTFWNLDSRKDEDLFECQQWWVCPADQWRCLTGQCIDRHWKLDNDWDCGDASDEHDILSGTVKSTLHQVSMHGPDAQSYSMPTTCNRTRPFLCPSPRASRYRTSCISLEQIGDRKIDCAGGIDERNTIKHCSHSSSMLGLNFRCLSTNTCIPYWMHCWKNNRCPNRSDDEHWCYRRNQTSTSLTPGDALCFDGEIYRNGRCNGAPDCQYHEDEYMCDYASLSRGTSLPYREGKESVARSARRILRLSRYPTDANITLLNHHSPSSVEPLEDLSENSFSTSLSPYWCNRGLGILLSNDSIVCFCPPQYFGDKCQYQTDRLSVLLSLDLSQSIYRSGSDPEILLKVLVLFLFKNQTLMTHEFHVRPALQFRSKQKNQKKKMIVHFLYSQSASFREHRLQRLKNRSSLINIHPYSIRIEIYETRRSKSPSLIAIWQYPIHFDYLPVFRLAKILHLPGSVDHRNPCSSSLCHYDHEECHPLVNDRSTNVCLCKPNFTGENCSRPNLQCLNGYCASGSLCKSNYQGDDSLLCLCPSDRSGDRCDLEHDACLANPCLNGGSCFPASQPDQVICFCTMEYFGLNCQWKRSHLRLSLVDSSSHAGAVLQYFHLDSTSLHLILVDQQAVERLPSWIESYDDQKILPEIVLARLYSSHEDSSPELHLLSSHQNAISVEGSTEISEINRCSHLRTFSNGNLDLSLDVH